MREQIAEILLFYGSRKFQSDRNFLYILHVERQFICTKISAKRWQAFLKSVNLYLIVININFFGTSTLPIFFAFLKSRDKIRVTVQFVRSMDSLARQRPT